MRKLTDLQAQLLSALLGLPDATGTSREICFAAWGNRPTPRQMKRVRDCLSNMVRGGLVYRHAPTVSLVWWELGMAGEKRLKQHKEGGETDAEADR